jgi:hypothetical protein
MTQVNKYHFTPINQLSLSETTYGSKHKLCKMYRLSMNYFSCTVFVIIMG